MDKKVKVDKELSSTEESDQVRKLAIKLKISEERVLAMLNIITNSATELLEFFNEGSNSRLLLYALIVFKMSA